MTPARAGTSAVASVLGAALLVTVLVSVLTWAAATGPEEVLHRPGLARHSAAIGSGDPSADGLLGRGPRWVHATPAQPAGWVGVVADVLLVALAALGAAMLSRLALLAWRAWRARRLRPRRAVEQVGFETLVARTVPADDLAAGGRAAASDLEEGSPRNAIVACWHRFETTAERAGVRRRRWQTSSEFVLEVLEQAGAETGAVTRLAELYREARFSDHALDESARARARTALADTLDSLPARTAAHGAAR